MDDFSKICNICSIIKVPACYENQSKLTCINLIHQKNFYDSNATETGQSDFYRMTITIMETTFCKQEPKIIHDRDYKIFSNNAFRKDLLLEELSNGHASESDNLSSFINARVKALYKQRVLCA